MGVRYNEYEDFYAGNLNRGNKPCFGLVESIDPVTQLVSGSLVDMANRQFTNAFVVMPGGISWGTDWMPRPGDIVQVLTNVNNVSFVMPFSTTYGGSVQDVDVAAELGYKKLVPGEIHTHSYAHAETLMDSMGDWWAYDSVGDEISLDAATATLRVRALNQTIQTFGFLASGAPAVTFTAGIQNLSGFYGDGTKANPSIWRVDTDKHHLIMDGTDKAEIARLDTPAHHLILDSTEGNEVFEYKHLLKNTIIKVTETGDIVGVTAGGSTIQLEGDTGDGFISHSSGTSVNVYDDDIELVTKDESNLIIAKDFAQIFLSTGYYFSIAEDGQGEISVSKLVVDSDQVTLGSLKGQTPLMHAGFIYLYNVLLAALAAHTHVGVVTSGPGAGGAVVTVPSIELDTLPGYVPAGQATVTTPIVPPILPALPTPVPVNPLVTVQVTGD